MSTQNERVQQAIDLLPECFSADLIASHTQRLAAIFRGSIESDKLNEAMKNNVDLQNAADELVAIGQVLYDADAGKDVFYCKNSSEREDILRAYVRAYRLMDDTMMGVSSFWNPEIWKESVASTFKDIGALPGNIVKRVLLPTLEGLWPVIAVVAVAAIVIVVIQRKVA